MLSLKLTRDYSIGDSYSKNHSTTVWWWTPRAPQSQSLPPVSQAHVRTELNVFIGWEVKWNEMIEIDIQWEFNNRWDKARIEIEYVLNGLLAAEAGRVEWKEGCCQQLNWVTEGKTHMSAGEQVLFTHPTRPIEMKWDETSWTGGGGGWEVCGGDEMKNRKDVFVV